MRNMNEAPQQPSVQPSLFRRGPIFWAKVRHVEPDGRKVWKNYSTRQQERNLARDEATAMQIRADKGLPPVEKQDGKAMPAAALLTVRQLAERFLTSYRGRGHRLKDIDVYRQRARWDMTYLLYPYLGDARAATLRRGDVKAYLQRLREEKDYSDGTLQVALARLSSVFAWAIEEEIIDISSPCQGIHLDKAPPSEEHYTLEQIGRLLALPDVPMMLICALYTGMRPGELRAAQWEWIDLDERVITVRASWRTPSPKNQRPRQIPIHRELLPHLKRHKASQKTDPGGLVFPEPRLNGAGHVIGWRMAWPKENDFLEEIMKRADAPIYDRPWKACRHSLGTHLTKATRGNFDVVSKILGNGHGSHVASVTMGYIHTADLAYIAAELDKLSYAPAVTGAAKGKGGKVVSFAAEQERRRGRAQPRKTETAATGGEGGDLVQNMVQSASDKDSAS